MPRLGRSIVNPPSLKRRNSTFHELQNTSRSYTISTKITSRIAAYNLRNCLLKSDKTSSVPFPRHSLLVRNSRTLRLFLMPRCSLATAPPTPTSTTRKGILVSKHPDVVDFLGMLRFASSVRLRLRPLTLTKRLQAISMNGLG